jgi:hypothetical protein
MQHSIGYVNGDFYGARATLNVWAPQLEGQEEFSLAQMWITSDGSHYEDDRNTLEAGWQACYISLIYFILIHCFCIVFLLFGFKFLFSANNIHTYHIIHRSQQVTYL